jgi:hypothetical protein
LLLPPFVLYAMLCCVHTNHPTPSDGLARELDEEEYGPNIDFREYSFLNNTIVSDRRVRGVLKKCDTPDTE